MLKIYINGFGRIGRSIFKAIKEESNISIAGINDTNPDIENICYQLNYDSTYGGLKKKFYKTSNNQISDGTLKIKVLNKQVLKPNELNNTDILVESNGLDRNLKYIKSFRGKVKHIIFTNIQSKIKTKYVLPGINHDQLKKNDFLISSGTCDGNAVVPFLKLIDKKYKIKYGNITTLHPWLSYQNLLDGPATSVSDPKNIYSTYVLGRSTLNNIIPKSTSVVTVASKILKGINRKISSMSFRVPTSIISCAKLNLVLKKNTNTNQIVSIIDSFNKNQNFNLIKNYNEPLTSIDFLNSTYSCNNDIRFLNVNKNFLNALIWYDNENGYTSRVIDLIKILKKISKK